MYVVVTDIIAAIYSYAVITVVGAAIYPYVVISVDVAAIYPTKGKCFLLPLCK